jgi:hypothetical protein
VADSNLLRTTHLHNEQVHSTTVDAYHRLAQNMIGIKELILWVKVRESLLTQTP